MGNQGRYGSGARSEPQDGLGSGRRDVPFGPEISWPYGFRQLDPESRDVLESAYGTGPAYQQPAMDDFGYGDPGYSDPSYEGPKSGPYGNPAFPAGHGNTGTPRDFGGAGYRPSGSAGSVPGYHVPDVRDSAPSAGYQAPGYSGSGYQPQPLAPPSGGSQDIWPVTGAQEALPDTGPQPEIRGGASRGSAAYPEQWYESPRLDDRARDDRTRDDRALDDRGPGDVRPSRSADPRLAGLTYGELRYDEPEAGRSGYDEPLDGESWYQELRRSAPAYPQTPGGPQGPGSGPQRRTEPSGPAFGQQPGYSPAPDRAPGYGQPRHGSAPKTPKTPNGPQGPQMSAGRPQQGPAAPGAGFLSAPVGLLTPPNGTRVDALRDPAARPAAPAVGPRGSSAATQVLTAPKAPAPKTPGPKTGSPTAPNPKLPNPAAQSPKAQSPKAPGAGRVGTATVRPGHGLDGPEITSSWPAQPAVDDHPDSYQDFWRDDADEEYTGLFGDREAEFERADAKLAAAKRQIGRRRGGSNDHRLWLGLGGVIVIAAAAIVGVIKFEFPSHSGPVHTMTTPNKIGTFARTVDLEHEADVNALKQKVIRMSAGEASNVKSAVYESGNSAAGNTAQIIMYIGGHLANADPAASIASFTQQFRGAKVVSAGALGGKAACVQDGTGSNSVAMCAWFDNDSFGEVVSPTMKATALASAMQKVRPSVEQVSGK